MLPAFSRLFSTLPVSSAFGHVSRFNGAHAAHAAHATRRIRRFCIILYEHETIHDAIRKLKETLPLESTSDKRI